MSDIPGNYDQWRFEMLLTRHRLRPLPTQDNIAINGVSLVAHGGSALALRRDRGGVRVRFPIFGPSG